METFEVALEALKREKESMQETIQRLRQQVSCEHPKDQLTIQQNVGYDVDEEGEEDQHLETCGKCGAQRFHIDHTKHGKSIGCWMAT